MSKNGWICRGADRLHQLKQVTRWESPHCPFMCLYHDGLVHSVCLAILLSKKDFLTVISNFYIDHIFKHWGANT